MKNTKTQLKTLIASLPESKEQLFELEHIEAFPDLVLALLKVQSEWYNEAAWKQLQASQPFEFVFLVNKFVDTLEQQATWVDACKAVFETNLLNDFTKRLLQESSTKITATQKRLEDLNTEIVKIQKEREELSAATTALEQLEPKYKQLIENKDLLVSRKLELEELEAAVEAGNLVELASSIEAKESEMQPVIAEKQRLEERRATLLSEQTTNEQKVQALIAQAQTIGRASALFQEMENKIKQHNEEILKDFQEESELLRLQLDFNQRTSGELIDAPLEKIMVDIKAGLVEIEKRLKEKIAAQTIQQA